MLASYREDGFAVCRQIIPRDVIDRLLRFATAQVDAMMADLATVGVKPDIRTAAADIRRILSSDQLDEVSPDLRVRMTGHYPASARLSEELWAVPRSAPVRELLEGLFNAEELRMHLPPMARFVLPGNADAGVPPHQDASYNQHMGDFLTFWMPLVPVDVACGGVICYRGRKDGVLPPTGRVKHGVWLEGIDTAGLEPVSCVPMQPGDALVFNPFVVHQSMPNLSDGIRFSLDYRFFPASAESEKHYLDVQNWTVHAPKEATL